MSRERLRDLIAQSRRAVIFTGAGISTESGIPDFRSPGGVWSRMKPIYFDEFVKNEERRREAWNRTFSGAAGWNGKKPNQGHYAVARLVARGTVAAVITQNVDNLHQGAGVPPEQVIELHGNATYAKCLECGLRHELEVLKQSFLGRGEIPSCRKCDGLVKTATISFGQAMPQAEMMRAEAETLAADLFIVLGSSLVVYPAAGFPLLAKENGARLAIVNREPTPQDEYADLALHDEIGPTMAAVVPVDWVRFRPSSGARNSAKIGSDVTFAFAGHRMGAMPASILANQRAIFDRRAVQEQLAALAQKGEPDRRAVVEVLRAALQKGRAEVRERFERQASDGGEVVRSLSFLMDQLIRALYDFITGTVYPLANPTAGEHMAVVAVGGYGRGELAPFSDIDLLFLRPYKATPYTEQVVEYLLYTLWDLGLKVGHSTRTVEDCLRQGRQDQTIRTALLEARYLWGDQYLAVELRRRFEDEFLKKGSAPEFVEAKLAERDERHLRLGDSRYQVEPNVKEGKGGLRDLHTLYWIAKYIYRVDDVAKLVEKGVLSPKESQRFARAQNFLWTVRCHLHYLAGRAEDRLGFNYQSEIGRRMGYTDHAGTRGVERFMKHYFLVAKDVGDLTRIFCAVLETEQQKPRFSLRRWGFFKKHVDGFAVDAGRLDVESESAFADDPVNLIRLFQVADEHELDIHPHALRVITQSLKLIDGKLRENAEANRLFLEILTSRKDPAVALRRMNEAGVFGRFVPDFGRVVAQMQYDMYHSYTVDEHSIFAIAILHEIEVGKLRDELPLASQIIETVVSRRALYLAVLLHDIAKGRGGDHSVLGAEVAQRLGPRLGLTEEETETAAWLVRWHLLMSNTAFKRDIDDPQTIRDFAERVQSPERLKLLLILTIADIRAVGPKVWNGWKGSLLIELYHRAIDQLSGGLVASPIDQRVATAQQAVRALLPEFNNGDFATLAERAYPSYWVSFEPETLARHARLMREAEASLAPLSVATRVDPASAVTEVTLYTADHAGLFSRMAGALALAGANIVDARIITMANGMALDTFWVQDAEGGAFDRGDKLAKLSVLFEQVLTGARKPHLELAAPTAYPTRARAFTVAPRVLIDNRASATHTVIEVNGRDRPGILFELTRTLTQLNLQINSAKISTYGEKVVDVFYVKDLFGHKIEHEQKLRDIHERLIEVLSDRDTTAERAPVRPRRADEVAAE